MPGETSVNKIPYPLDVDAPDGPTQIKALADLLDTLKWGSRNLKPTAGVVAASELMVPGGSYSDVPGAVLEVTPSVESKLIVIASFTTTGSGIGSNFTGTIRLDSTDQARVVRWGLGGGTDIWVEKTLTQVYALTLSPEKHTVKMRAKASGSNLNVSTNTAFAYLLLAS